MRVCAGFSRRCADLTARLGSFANANAVRLLPQPDSLASLTDGDGRLARVACQAGSRVKRQVAQVPMFMKVAPIAPTLT